MLLRARTGHATPRCSVWRAGPSSTPRVRPAGPTPDLAPRQDQAVLDAVRAFHGCGGGGCGLRAAVTLSAVVVACGGGAGAGASAVDGGWTSGEGEDDDDDDVNS